HHANDFARRLDKLPLPCGIAPDLVHNRVLAPDIQGATLAAREGVSRTRIDAAAVGGAIAPGSTELTEKDGRDDDADDGCTTATGVARVSELAARYGDRFQPDLGWASIESRAEP